MYVERLSPVQGLVLHEKSGNTTWWRCRHSGKPRRVAAGTPSVETMQAVIHARAADDAGSDSSLLQELNAQEAQRVQVRPKRSPAATSSSTSACERAGESSVSDQGAGAGDDAVDDVHSDENRRKRIRSLNPDGTIRYSEKLGTATAWCHPVQYHRCVAD